MLSFRGRPRLRGVVGAEVSPFGWAVCGSVASKGGSDAIGSVSALGEVDGGDSFATCVLSSAVESSASAYTQVRRHDSLRVGQQMIEHPYLPVVVSFYEEAFVLFY